MKHAAIVRGNALTMPLRDASVDLIVTSPPYFGQRSYQDGGDHYDGQVGSEEHPQAFLEALWDVMAECWRVLKPSGSCWVNLGDKRAGSGGHNNAGISAKSTLAGNGHVGGVGKAGPQKIKSTLRSAPDRYVQAHFGRRKGKQLLPHRFAIGCEDGLADPEGIGWIVRQDGVWSKPNGLPESVTDRTVDRHEFWFHMTKEPVYFAAIDEVREPHAEWTLRAYEYEASAGGSYDRRSNGDRQDAGNPNSPQANPLGKVPGSVWSVPLQPLLIPESARRRYDLPDHFAAFPQEFPRRIVLGWSPANGVVLDPFGGTGTTAGVAHALGRVGISLDLSNDYCRLAAWRARHSGHFARAAARTDRERQEVLL